MRHVRKTTSITIAAGYQFINCKTIRLSYSMSCVLLQGKSPWYCSFRFSLNALIFVLSAYNGHGVFSMRKLHLIRKCTKVTAKKAAELMEGFVIESLPSGPLTKLLSLIDKLHGVVRGRRLSLPMSKCT